MSEAEKKEIEDFAHDKEKQQPVVKSEKNPMCKHLRPWVFKEELKRFTRVSFTRDDALKGVKNNLLPKLHEIQYVFFKYGNRV